MLHTLRAGYAKTEPVRILLRKKHIRAGLKALVFGLLLFHVQSAEFSVFSVGLLIIWSLFMYLTPVMRTMRGPIAWFTLVLLSIMMPSRFTLVTPQWAPHHILPEHVFAVIFAVLAYIFLCVSQNIVRQPDRWYQALHAGLVWGTSLLFVAGQSGLHPLRATIIGSLLLYLLTTEYLRMHGQREQRLVRLTGALITLQFVESVWVLRLLPLSLGYVAAALALLCIVSTAASDQYLRGTLRGPFLRYAAMTIGLAIIVIAVSTRWVL